MRGTTILAISLFLIGFLILSSITISAIENDMNQNQDSGVTRERIKEVIENRFFCGKSTFGACQTDADCITAGCSNSVCQSKTEEQSVTTCEWKDCYNSSTYKVNCLCINNKCAWSKLTAEQIQEIIAERHRIKFEERTGTSCPDQCVCTGSSIKCTLANGRNMTIIAGKSGNIIIQIKGENMTTNVTLYKVDGKLYGVFKNNETKEIKMLPDQVRERIKEKIKAKLQNENVTLDENGNYSYKAVKQARLFFIIPVRVAVDAKIDPTTGDITSLKTRWWSFLARDVEEQPLLGASCGTVTPGQNDGCCQGRGYDFWNSETQQCEFNQ